MPKAKPHLTHQGKSYIQLSRLPINQIVGIREALPISSFVSVHIQDQVFSGLIEYFEYEIWFDDYFDQEDLFQFDQVEFDF